MAEELTILFSVYRVYAVAGLPDYRASSHLGNSLLNELVVNLMVILSSSPSTTPPTLYPLIPTPIPNQL